MINSWITIAVVTFIGIFPIANPFSTAVVFFTITERFSEDRRRQQVRLACVYMAAALITFLLLGSVIMNFFGIFNREIHAGIGGASSGTGLIDKTRLFRKFV